MKNFRKKNIQILFTKANESCDMCKQRHVILGVIKVNENPECEWDKISIFVLFF
jgi:hypothetical protein